MPIFFIISGFFLGQHINEDGWYGRAVKKRIRTLVIPFFALNLFWWPVKYGMHYVGVRYFGMNGTNPNEDITLYNFFYYTGLLPWGGDCVVGLWYVRALFYLVISSPILVWLITKGKVVALSLLFALLILWCVQMEMMPIAGKFLESKMRAEYCLRCPLYFGIGLLISQIKPIAFPKWASVAVIPVAILLLYCQKMCQFNMVSAKVVIGFFATIAIALALWTIIPSEKWPKVLTSNSFTVFVLHGMILYLFPIVFKALKIWDATLNAIGGVVYWVAVIALSIVIAEVIKRRFPKIACIAFGGRC